MSGYPPPRPKTGKDAAPTLSARAHGGGGPGKDFDLEGGLIDRVAYGGNNTTGPIDVSAAINACPTASGRLDFDTKTFIAHSLYAEGWDAAEVGTGRGTPLVPIAVYASDEHNKSNEISDAIAFNLRGREGGAMPEQASAASVRAAMGGSRNSYVAFSAKDYGADVSAVAPTLRGMGHTSSHANAGGQLAIAFRNNQRRELRERDVHGSLNGTRSGKQSTASSRRRPSPCHRLCIVLSKPTVSARAVVHRTRSVLRLGCVGLRRVNASGCRGSQMTIRRLNTAAS
jgi:DNA (cytosine-5)-methyltransferase 1